MAEQGSLVGDHLRDHVVDAVFDDEVLAVHDSNDRIRTRFNCLDAVGVEDEPGSVQAREIDHVHTLVARVATATRLTPLADARLILRSTVQDHEG